MHHGFQLLAMPAVVLHIAMIVDLYREQVDR
jgi:hypothetical protein